MAAIVGLPLGWLCGCILRCGVATGVAAPPPAARQAILLQLQPPEANARTRAGQPPSAV